LDANGRLIARSTEDVPASSRKRADSATLLESASFEQFVNSAAAAEQFFGMVEGGRSGYRAFARRFTAQGNPYTLVILRSLHPRSEMLEEVTGGAKRDRKSTRLNSSHDQISYAVFCLKKKKRKKIYKR